MHVDNVELFRSRARCEEYLESVRHAVAYGTAAPPPGARQHAECSYVNTPDPIVQESLDKLARERPAG